MKKEIAEKLEKLKSKAKENEGKKYSFSNRSRSSLGQVIKTKKQADAFMKQLASA
jgi:hypothetical protein